MADLSFEQINERQADINAKLERWRKVFDSFDYAAYLDQCKDAGIAERYRMLEFVKGRTLLIEVKVEDSLLSAFLWKWLYQPDFQDMFGCRCQSIHFQHPKKI